MERTRKKSMPQSSSDDSSEEQDVKLFSVPLKLKHKNRVKKIAGLPNEFIQLDNIVKKKYDEFKKGKETYTMCYLDDENDLVNISDDEDYTMFKKHVKGLDLNTAKVFLTHKGEEDKFNPMLDDAQTVNESVILDEELNRIQMMRSSLENPFAYNNSSNVPNELLKEIKAKLDKLMKKKDKKKDSKKEKKDSKKEKKVKTKSKKVEKEKKPKTDRKKEKAKPKEKEVKLSRSSSTEMVEIIGVESDIEIEVKKIEPSQIKLEQPIQKIPVLVLPKPIKPAKKLKTSTSSRSRSWDEKSVEEVKHEHSIQPAFKRIPEQPKEIKDTHCSECKDVISEQTKYVCSICPDYFSCELCEIKSGHNHVFIKLKPGVKFDSKAYDEFWQKMIGIYAPPANFEEEREIQEAILNDDKDDKPVRIQPLMAKRAQMINKDAYKQGLIAKKGEKIEITWEVKNFTNREWSKDVIITWLPGSDLIVNEQKVDLCLKGGQKGKVIVNFIVPRNTKNKEILGVNLCLFDRVENKYIGDELKVNLALIS